MKSRYRKIEDYLYKVFLFINNGYLRDVWVIEKLQSIPKGKKLLDAGAGECKYKKYCSHLIYKSQDFGKYNGAGDGVGLQTKVWDTSSIDIVSDIINIPVEDKSFDYILCTEVLEHIPRPDEAIKEFSRILKPRGELILPLVLILFILSKFTKGSEKQMCFGYHVLAEKAR